MSGAPPPGIRADNSAAGLGGQLDQVWTALATFGATLTDEEWAAPSPCPGWPVSAQYAHVIGTESMLLGRPNPEVDLGERAHVRNPIAEFNEAWVVALADETRIEVLDRFGEVTGARRAALAAMGEDDFSKPSWTPVGEADYRRFMQIRVFDCWVHLQDVRDAVGRPGDGSGPVAEQAVDEIVRALGLLVGKRAGAPEGSSVTLNLTGDVERPLHVMVEGRARVVEGLDGPATATLTLPSGIFTRLACGRVAPAKVASDIRAEGDGDLAQRVIDHLAFTI